MKRKQHVQSLVCGINVTLVQLQGMNDMQENVFLKRDRTSGADLGGGEGAEPSAFFLYNI